MLGTRGDIDLLSYLLNVIMHAFSLKKVCILFLTVAFRADVIGNSLWRIVVWTQCDYGQSSTPMLKFIYFKFLDCSICINMSEIRKLGVFPFWSIIC